MITLATLKDATAQEVYDQVKNHLLTQNKRSEGIDSCVYRNNYGLKCAAGCLISDEEYNKDMENRAWDDPMFPEYHRQLIRGMQKIHDVADVRKWRYELKLLAISHNLNP